MEKERISVHPSVQQAYERIKREGLTNVWDRYQAQGLGSNPDQRCPFCMGGVRCDLCSNGPCRADAAKDKRGVCGITADGMAMRMMLLRNVMGASTYHYHTEQTIKTLKATVEGKRPSPSGSRRSSFSLPKGLASRKRILPPKRPWPCALSVKPTSISKTGKARSSRPWPRKRGRPYGAG